MLRNKLITQGEKQETSTKTCNKTMSRDKLRVLVSRISLPLPLTLSWQNTNLVLIDFNMSYYFIVQMPTKTHGNASQYQSAYTSGQHGTHNFASGRFTMWIN